MNAIARNSIAATALALGLAACFEPFSGSDLSSVHVSVSGTPEGLELTSFLDDLTGPGSPIRRPIAIGSTVIYSRLIRDYDVEVSIEPPATHTCVAIDSSGLDVPLVPVRLRTQGQQSVEFRVRCNSAPQIEASLEITPAAPTTFVGASVQLSAVARDAAGNPVTGVAITWATGNASIAHVTNTGLVSGNGVGTTAIHASTPRVTASTTVRVLASAPATIAGPRKP